MKKLMTYSIFLIVALLAFSDGRAEENPWAEKTKTITKIFPLKAGQKVSITNSFGEVKVNNWNRNEVKVEITIKVSSSSEKTAQQIFDQIRIEENRGTDISFETKTGSNTSNKNGVKTTGRNSKMEINYLVTLPPQTPLFVKNSFGNTFLPNRNGPIVLRQSFGELNAGDLRKDADIKVEFGKLFADRVDGSKIKSSYSEVNVKNLAGDVKTNFEFCKKLQIGLSNDIETLTLNASYSDLKIVIPRNFDGDFRVKTSFGKAQSGTFLKLTDKTKEEKYVPSFDRTYTGKTGNGKTIIVINSSFGDVKFD